MTIGETEGVRVLRAAFVAAGLDIEDAFPVEIAGKTVRLDGFDPKRLIGFEYITTEAGDREEMSADVVAELERRMTAGELYVLLVDEAEVESAGVLERAAAHFLDAMRSRGRLGDAR